MYYVVCRKTTIANFEMRIAENALAIMSVSHSHETRAPNSELSAPSIIVVGV